MKDKIIPILMVFGLSMFCGILGVGIGLGSVFVPLNGVGASIVCGQRELKIERQTYSYMPGREYTEITAYCVDSQSGDRQEVTAQLYDVTGKLQLANGIIFGLIFFALAMAFLKWAARRLNIPFEDMFKPTARKV